MNIFEKIAVQHQQKLPFVAYRKPNENKVSAFFQQTDEIFYSKNYTESGFVFAPFNDENSTVLIPENQSDFLSEEVKITEIFELKTSFPKDTSSKDFHIKLVKKGIDTIENEQFKKVVLSRKEEVQLVDFDLITVFQKLLQTYPTAFVYVWFHPKVGLWLGATPETLLKIKGQHFETMALAGTQTYKGTTDVTWQQKEIEEQQFVTDYIVSNLKESNINVNISEVETVKAGSLLHLRTAISGNLQLENWNLQGLIQSLHPTPAVCGLPKNTSKEFIIANENYKREFYTGFLGELNLNEVSQLFVNLRCVQIKNLNALIYVGGGITKDSNSQKEWEETVAKSTTIKSVL